MKTSTHKEVINCRSDERGAALVTTMLVTALLLGFCGVLLMTASTTATNSFNSTAEMQAYYAAEAGLQTSLNVLRGNVAPWDSTLAAANTKMTFRNAVTPLYSNYTGDSGSARLSGWLVYNTTYTDRVTLTPNYTPASGCAYSVTVKNVDSDLTRPEPRKVLIQVKGYGPNYAVKYMEMVVTGTFLGNFTAPSPITVIGSPTTVATISIGTSNPFVVSGQDQAKPINNYPAIGVTTQRDLDAARTAIGNNNINVSPTPKLLTTEEIPYYVQTADAARAVLDDLETVSRNIGRYYDASNPPPDLGSPTQPKLTFINGDASLSQNMGVGAGILVVTGNLDIDGNYSFNGLVLALGGGSLVRSGGGGGVIGGAMIIAKFDRYAVGNPFLSPVFNTSGGGNSTVQYNSDFINQTLNAVRRPLGIVER
jgi:Tfp pilus assembly protein PilX